MFGLGLGRLGLPGTVHESGDFGAENLETEDGFNLLQENGYYILLEN
jgi:hypothetical protein